MNAEPTALRAAAAASRPFESARIGARTEREGVRVTVKEWEDGRPFLMFQGAGLPSLPGVCFGLDLAPETTLEHARQLAETLNGWVVGPRAVTFEPVRSSPPNGQDAP